MNRWVGNTLLVLLSLVVAGALLEVACRTVMDTGLQYDLEMWKYATRLKRVAADPAMGHEHVPGARAHLMGVDVAINSQGLRDREVSAEKPAGVTRILMLGDSVTLGWGVAADQTLPAAFERNLNIGGMGPVEVINSGVGNYNTAMEVTYFLAKGAPYQPDIVVLNYFINDAEPTPTHASLTWIASHAYAYAVLGGAWDTTRRLLRGAPEWRDYYASLYAEGAPGWKRTQESIEKLAAYCRVHGIRLVLANIPELRELKNYPFTEANRKVAAVAADNGIAYIDLLPALQLEEPSSLWVTRPDPHPNAKAQGLLARALTDYFLATPPPKP